MKSRGIINLDLDPGDEVKEIESKTPNPNMVAFTRELVRSILLALDIPFTFYDSLTASFSARIADRNEYEESCEWKRAKNQDVLAEIYDWVIPMWAEADLPDTSYAHDLRSLIERGDVRTMSFGFSTVKDNWSPDGNERTLQEVRLHEVSVVTGVAAYPATSASVRNLRLLAKRTNTDVDALADAISALESGDALTDDQASVLQEVVDRSRPDKAADPTVPLSILQKQIDLWGKDL